MRPGIRRGVCFCFGWAVLAWQLGACTFPDFVVPRGGASAGGSASGASGSGQPSTAGEGASDSGGEPSAGKGSGGSSVTEGGDAGAAGDPIVVDIGPCGQRKHAL